MTTQIRKIYLIKIHKLPCKIVSKKIIIRMFKIYLDKIKKIIYKILMKIK
jgi:hypothetical protein